MRQNGGAEHQKQGAKNALRAKAEETAGAVSGEAPKPSPWDTRMVSLHGQLRVRSAGEATRS